MLFNLFGRKEKSSHRFTDLVFLSEKGKQNAIIHFANQEAGAVFIAWFQDTAIAYRQLFTRHGLNDTRVEDAKYFMAAKYAGSVIVFLEHYPLRKKENTLVQNCVQESFSVYNSLTEPLFNYFSGDRIVEMMQKLGMEENENLQHKMISKSLLNAQENISKKVSYEKSADSQREWLLLNVGKQ